MLQQGVGVALFRVVPDGLDPRSVRRLPVALEAPPPQHRRAGFTSSAGEFACESRLADARLTDNHHDLAPPNGCVVQGSLQAGELIGSAYEPIRARRRSGRRALRLRIG